MMPFPFIRVALILPTLIIIYWFWVRPILRSRPSLKAFYDAEAGWWAAFSEKFAGIKQKLAGALLAAASIIIELYDFVAPAIGAVDTTPLTSHVPTWAWPIISICAILLLNYLRSLGDKRNDETVAVLADALVVNDVPIPAEVAPVVAAAVTKAV